MKLLRSSLLLGALCLLACPSPSGPFVGPGSVGACEVDAGQNPASCPATWGEARERCGKSCTANESGCAYAGAGDETGGCYATAVLICTELDAGVSEWRCAQ